MSRTATALLALLLALPLAAEERTYDYVFFDNSLMEGSWFYSSVKYEHPSWVKNLRGKLPLSEAFYYSPGNALELEYSGSRWEAAVQYSDIRGVERFSAPEVLSMKVYARSFSGELPSLALANRKGERSHLVPLQPYITATGEWLSVRIPVSAFGEDLSQTLPKDPDGIVEGRGLLRSAAALLFVAGEGCGQLYLDDIELLPQATQEGTPGAPVLLEAKGWESHVDLRWQKVDGVKYYKIYQSLDGTQYKAVDIRRPWMDRCAHFVETPGIKAWYKVSAVGPDGSESPLSNVLCAQTRPMTDEELLDMVQEACFRYYWEGGEAVSGLALEDIPGHGDMIAAGASGFGMMAILAGIHRGFITRADGVERFLRITAFLEKAERHHGVYSHFMDGPTGKTVAWFGRRDNGGDLVETAFMYEGLLCARQFFDGKSREEKQIRERIDRIWRSTEWDWYRRYPDSPYLYWHWSPDQEWVINHRLIGWNETMAVYLMAIASPTHGVPASMYYSGWASQDDIAAKYRANWGRVHDGERYTNGNTYFGEKLDVGVSNGGPLFFCHYSFLGFDPHKLTDRYTNYYQNNSTIARINLKYCTENPGGFQGYGPDCWGITASDQMWGYRAGEPVADLDNGTIAPTGALASFPYTPEASMAALRNYYRNYGRFLWGEYGFRDAFNLSENWVSPIFMGLNQGPVTVMIENWRSGLLWSLMMSHPDIAKIPTLL